MSNLEKEFKELVTNLHNKIQLNEEVFTYELLNLTNLLDLEIDKRNNEDWDDNGCWDESSC